MLRITKYVIAFVLIISTYNFAQEKTGWWKFDDESNLTEPNDGVGSPLELVGTHEATQGYSTADGAVKIGVGSYYIMDHNIEPNGGGTRVNEFSLMIDFMIENNSIWHTFFQTNLANDDDGDCFINTSGKIGVWATGYTQDFAAQPNEWYRLVISVQNGGFYRYYINGQIVNDGASQDVDGRFGLDSLLLMFADNDSEDNDIYVSELAVWNYALTSNEISSLGSVGEDPWLIFNGIIVNNTFSSFTWGQSQLGIVENAGEDGTTSALLWTQGNEWGNGWTGAGWNVEPARNLAARWEVDSLKFKLKTDEGVGLLRIQFESGSNGKVGYFFQPTADNQWHDYAIALADFENVDGTNAFDSSAISVFQFIAEASGQAGKKLYFNTIWTGEPNVDFVPPTAPEGVMIVQGAYQNLIIWSDVAGEQNEVYDIYYSFNQITSLDDPNLEVLGTKISENVQTMTHVLKAPLTNQDLAYYYAIVCTDSYGNQSPVVSNGPIVNTAQGVTTIYKTAPTNFSADGNLSEWTSIPKFRVFPSDGSGTIVNNTSIDGDADLSANFWVAFDDNYIYFAADVEDEIVSTDTIIASYLQDAPDLFLGLYNWHGASHTNYERGDEPDYHFRFNVNQMFNDNLGLIMDRPGENYAWVNQFPTGYNIEGKISLDELVAMTGDARFHSLEGMRIPIDFCINDADATGEREGILTFSPNNQDQSWADVSRWTYTWVGNAMVGNGEPNNPVEFTLNQNYPNPFNPSTTISYSIAQNSNVSLKIYDVIGKEVMSLVNQQQVAGSYRVTFNASHLSSGVYFYKLQSENFVATKKMVLVK